MERQNIDKQHKAQLRVEEVERSILVSDLPRDVSENEIIIHFQCRRNGGGDVERIICEERKCCAVVVFAETEDAKLVLKTNQRFRDKLQITVNPVVLGNKNMENNDMEIDEELTVFESVSGLLHPKLFEGLSEMEWTAIIAKVNENASVHWVPSNVGLLSTGTLSQLERARNVLKKEIKIARTRKNHVVSQNDYFKSHDQHDEAVGVVGYVNKSCSERKREDDKASEEPKSILPDSKLGAKHHDEAVGVVGYLNKSCSERKREDDKASEEPKSILPDSKLGAKHHDEAVGVVRYVNKSCSERKREDDKASEEPKSILPDSKLGAKHHDEAVGVVRYVNKSCSGRKREDDKASEEPKLILPDSKLGAKEKIELRSSKTLEKIQKINGVQTPEKTPRSNSKVTITQINGTTQSNSHRDHGSSNSFSQSTSVQRRKFGGEKPGYKKGRATKEPMKKNSEDDQLIKNLPNNVSVKIIQGDITNQQHTDVIVNPCNNNRLQNKSGVGAAIIDNGGLSIQIELNSTLEDEEFIPPNKVIKTSPGSLPYKNIYHLVCQQWDSSHKERSSKVLHAMCLKSLNQFSETEMKTIAYPTFSSFSFPIPEDTCAHVMLNAVNVFAEKRNSNSTMNVHFVIKNHETLKVFQNEFNKLFSASTSQKTKFYKADEKFTEGKMKTTGIGKKKQLPSETASLTSQILDANEVMNDKCPVCLDKIHQPKTLEKCQHTFCKSCVDRSFQVKKMCPLCKLSYVEVTGNQPNGKMSFTKEPSSLPGFSECGTIVITYHFRGGIQGARHPNPGQRYSGTSRVAYLPDNKEGNEVLCLLEKAFANRLLFKLNTLPLRCNQITWGDIDLKSTRYGGPPNFGYPDADYLMRVKEQLATKGICP